MMDDAAAESSSVQEIYQYWSNLDVHALKKEFDLIASELTARQEESDISRRQLVEMSREFKKNHSPETMDAVVPLVKRFQAEIDSLSKRCKMAEAAFLGVYQRFIDLPDPRPALARQQNGAVQSSHPVTHVIAHSTNSAVADQLSRDDVCDLSRRPGVHRSSETQALAAHSNTTEDAESRPMNRLNDMDIPTHSLTASTATQQEEKCQQSATERNTNNSRRSTTVVGRLTSDDVIDCSTTPTDAMSGETPAEDQRHFVELLEAKLKNADSFNEVKQVLLAELAAYELTRKMHQPSRTLQSSSPTPVPQRELSPPSALQTSAPKLQESVSQIAINMRTSEPSDDLSCGVSHTAIHFDSIPVSITTPFSIASTSSIRAEPLPTGSLLHSSPMTPCPSLPVPLPSKIQAGLTTSAVVPSVPRSRKKLAAAARQHAQLSAQGMSATDAGVDMVSLDTAEVAQHVREILSTNNIGQRLFARHVLGLSQGTVSELLSKPKHWDKLTEKGRDSYRRMHQWIRDGGNIAVLKAYAPKKGGSVVVSGSGDHDDAATEERISQILSEAQAAMQKKQTDEQGESAGTMVACIYRQELARIQQQQQQQLKQQLEPDTSSVATTPPHDRAGHSSSSSSSHRRRQDSSARSRRAQQPQLASAGNDQTASGSSGATPSNTDTSLTQDIVARIYREELSKLADAAEASGNVEELAVYRRELERLSTSGNAGSRTGDWTGGRMVLNGSTSDGMTTIKHERSSSPLCDDMSDAPQDLRVVKKECSSMLSGPIDSGSWFPPPPAVMPLSLITTSQPLSLAIGMPAGQEPLRRAGSAFSLVQPRGSAAPKSTVDERRSVSPTMSCSHDATSSSGSLSGGSGSGSVGGSGGAGILSPLQQMQSIANLLLPKQSQQRPLRPVLPPITQDQVDRYCDLNTDDLVRRVKDALSQYSISQRLFGETVLGLSQGSVSDLLARPKPWHLLTQKGREPFIRMQMFLEDEAAVSRLVASQYQIPADKFLRTTSSTLPLYPNCSTPGDGLQDELHGGVATLYPSPPSPMQGGRSQSPNEDDRDDHEAHSTSYHSMGGDTSCPSPATPRADLSLCSRSSSLISHSVERTFLPDGDISHPLQTFLPQTSSALTGWRPDEPLRPLIHPSMTMIPPPTSAAFFPLNPAAAAAAAAAAFFHPALFQLDFQQRYAAAATDLRMEQQVMPSSGPVTTSASVPLPASVQPMDLAGNAEPDTLEMTTQVKEVLQYHNLGQKLFGEAVLGLSQGSVSELLSKPKPWRMLSVKGREPFVKMAAWLADPLSVNRLRVYQEQLKAGGKRRGSTDDSAGAASDGQQQSSSSPPQKKPRVFFSDDQKAALREAYARDSYPNQATLERLAVDLGVGTKTVVNWFHNHRMRAKQQQPPTTPGTPIGPSNDGVGGTTAAFPESGGSGGASSVAGESVGASLEVASRDSRSEGEEDEEDTAAASSDDAFYDLGRAPSGSPSLSAGRKPDEEDVTGSSRTWKDSVEAVKGKEGIADGLAAASAAAANNRRRKCARPQWHYEGTVLDRSQCPTTSETVDSAKRKTSEPSETQQLTRTTVTNADNNCSVENEDRDDTDIDGEDFNQSDRPVADCVEHRNTSPSTAGIPSFGFPVVGGTQANGVMAAQRCQILTSGGL